MTVVKETTTSDHIKKTKWNRSELCCYTILNRCGRTEKVFKINVRMNDVFIFDQRIYTESKEGMRKEG